MTQLASETVHAVVTAVREDLLGDSLAVSVTCTTTTGPSTLTVYDVADFSESGGSLRFGPFTVAYTGIDDDTNTITLFQPLRALVGTITVDVDSEVYVYDAANGQVPARYIATVASIDGATSDPIEAIVDQSLVHALAQAMRAPGSGEGVLLTRDGSQLKVTGLTGRAAALAALQLIQGGLTTRQNDDQAGVDIVGADVGTPGIYIIGVGGGVLGEGGQGMLISADSAGGVIKGYTGLLSEISPSSINPFVLGGQPGLVITGPATGGGPAAASVLSLTPGLINLAAATLVQIAGDINVGDDLDVAGGLTVAAAIVGAANLTGNKVFAANPDTTTSAANVRFSGTNQLVQVTSLTKHKHNPKPVSLERLRALLDVPVVDWVDAAEKKANKGRVTGLRRIPGVVAEDVAAADPEFADYDADGELAGVLYDRLALAQIQALLHRLEQVEAELADLKKES